MGEGRAERVAPMHRELAAHRIVPLPSPLSLFTATELNQLPIRNAAPATNIPQRNPATNRPLPPTSAPRSAIPTTPPTWRLALSTADPIPARSFGVCSITAAVI